MHLIVSAKDTVWCFLFFPPRTILGDMLKGLRHSNMDNKNGLKDSEQGHCDNMSRSHHTIDTTLRVDAAKELQCDIFLSFLIYFFDYIVLIFDNAYSTFITFSFTIIFEE